MLRVQHSQTAQRKASGHEFVPRWAVEGMPPPSGYTRMNKVLGSPGTGHVTEYAFSFFAVWVTVEAHVAHFVSPALCSWLVSTVLSALVRILFLLLFGATSE